MPKQPRDDSRMVRQWLLLQAITAGNGAASIKSLAGEQQVSEKTVRRDLALLQRAGFPIEEAVGEFNRKTYTLQNGGLPQLNFRYDEALALYLCRQAATTLTGTLVGQSLQHAFQKIRTAFGTRAIMYADKMLGRMIRTSIGGNYAEKAELIDQLMIGIEDSKAVFLTYRSQRSTEPVTYDCYPLFMLEHRGSLYLFGIFPDSGELRTWKIDRMLDAQVTEVPFQRPENFDPREHIAGSFGMYHGHGDVLVRIRFTLAAARYVSEKKMHASQRMTFERDGSAIVEFRLSNTTEVKSWALSFGSAAEVLEPKELREEMAAECDRLTALYAKQVRSKTNK